ncbi:cytochrome c oxidase assembly protein COX16 homolog, mitochondrial-like [Physeter macrocephalus]|uniref:Cytochrome c oxidase assembly protein COX16 homolog, mitochondrial n=1 Tax=Physeter macrocephalus TaxID=9755 RepID=A0A2Y9SA39_PHYMC|nr:cytochrome c oxidase assembly protein COX16 homolog, mitochondrial-like [Physeter catodon]|eukprot:XP_023975288.1 cytochrome c oxidase assembly protein COX16 homolog, mitochondrial-like [Physeter catodon]
MAMSMGQGVEHCDARLSGFGLKVSGTWSLHLPNVTRGKARSPERRPENELNDAALCYQMSSQALISADSKRCKTAASLSPLLIVGVSFGLHEFSQIHYDAVKIKIDPELEKKLKMNKVSLESEYEKIKDSTFDEWKNIQGPRPWEDPDLLQGRNPEILKTKTT